MIRKQNPEDMNQIMDFIKNNNVKFDGRMFLPGVMTDSTVYLDIENQAIKGLAYVNEKILKLHGKRIKVAYISVNMMSVESLKRLLTLLSRSDIITMIQSSADELIDKMDFESVIEINEYNVNVDYLPKIGVDGIVMNPLEDKLLEVYQKFTDHFAGFFERKASYYKSIKKVLGSSGNIIAYEEGGKTTGYLIYESYENVVVVKECCYEKSGQLLSMLAFASRGKRRLVIQSSSFEYLERILPQAKKTKQTFMLAAINDKELFEHLFHIKIISAYSAFNAFGKPLWNRDYF